MEPSRSDDGRRNVLVVDKLLGGVAEACMAIQVSCPVLGVFPFSGAIGMATVCRSQFVVGFLCDVQEVSKACNGALIVG